MIGAPVLEGGTPKLALRLLLSCQTDARFSTRDSLDRLQVERSFLRRAVPSRVALITSLNGLLQGRCSTQRTVQDSHVCRSGPVRPLRMASSMPSTATHFRAAFDVLSAAVLLQIRGPLSYRYPLKPALLASKRRWIPHRQLRLTYFVTGYVSCARSDIVW